MLGLTCIKDAVILPLATGMAITMALLTLNHQSKDATKEFVIIPRIDQKTCLKSICTANLGAIVSEPILKGETLCTNLADIEAILESAQYRGRVLCVLSTASCFAPRAYDDVVAIA